jgi:hypothetical protein
VQILCFEPGAWSFELSALNFANPFRLQRSKHKVQSSNFTRGGDRDRASPIFMLQKTDEGREKRTANTLRGTLLLRMATPDTLAKQRRRHPEGSLPSSKDSTRSVRLEFFHK